MELKLGCHLSVSDGWENMGKTALSIGAKTFQFFTRNPRGSAHREPTTQDVDALAELLVKNEFAPIIAHAPYTFNPCSADEGIRDYTKETMAKEVKLLERLPGAFYNFHPGNHVSQGVDIGIEKTADTLNAILKHANRTTVLIETMAGKGTEIGKSFEEIRRIIDLVDDTTHLGVCLDTCHVSDAGYDIASNPEAVLEEFDKIIGIGRLKAIHLNDSKNPLGAKKDRHEKIGFGTLALEGIRRIVSNPIIASLPICLETPNDLDGYAREIALIQDMVKHL